MYRKTNAAQDVTFDLQKKYMEAKEAVKELLEILIQKYLAELRKDPEKKAEFMYS